MMQTTAFSRHVFRAYDIRGQAVTEIDAVFAEALGRAFGTYLSDRAGYPGWIAVGRDNRQSSDSLHRALCRGLLSTGCNVLDIGLSPSPVMNFTVVNWRLDGGVNVTGSHTSPDKNGFKLVGPGAYPVAEDDIIELRDIMERGSFISGSGLLARTQPEEDYLNRISSMVVLDQKLTVVVDAGNGVVGLFAPALFRRLGCDVVELYCKDDGDYPNHIPNPENNATLEALKKVVVNCGADIGLAFDGDGDRLGVVDERGNDFPAEKIMSLLSRDFLSRHPGGKVIVDVKTSQAIIDEISRLGGMPVLWKTGHSLIKRKMSSENIMLGGEASGHFFPAEGYHPIDDGMLAACRILEYLSRQSAALSGLFEFGRWHHESFEAPCSEDSKTAIVEAAKAYFNRRYPVLTIDGARIEMNGGWALVRASNTGAALCLKFEAGTPENLADIKKEMLVFLSAFPAIQLPD